MRKQYVSPPRFSTHDRQTTLQTLAAELMKAPQQLGNSKRALTKGLEPKAVKVQCRRH